MMDSISTSPVKRVVQDIILSQKSSVHWSNDAVEYKGEEVLTKLVLSSSVSLGNRAWHVVL